jgi:hypothetical protein
MNQLWLDVLSQTHALGELFALGLHPERTMLCLEALTAVLGQARSLMPSVWIARLDEIAEWWRRRAVAKVQTAETGDASYRCVVSGPPGITLLARNLQADTQTYPWAEPYRVVQGHEVTVHAPVRPWIGLSPRVPAQLAAFLREQGFITEPADGAGRHSYYLDTSQFDPQAERAILAQFGDHRPLLRLGRWPNGARSALSITGDIDALALWGYGLRLVGK